MGKNWRIDTHGDPLGALQKFIRNLWQQAGLDILVVPPEDGGAALESADRVGDLNPFRPVMKLNTAQLVLEAVKKRPGKNLGAVLRPCELRALNEMAERGAVKREDVLVITTDCLGTFPSDEFEWRSERSPKGLTKEALQFAPQGGISAYRYRPACQMCAQPGATEGDVNIGVFGLPVRQSLLVNTGSESILLESFSDGQADNELASKREQTLGKISERHVRTRERVLKGLDEELPADLHELLSQLEACEDCRACMKVCPLCAADEPRTDAGGKLVREDVARWMLSCAGCGMCERSCSKHQPLHVIFNHIREHLDMEIT